MTRFWIDKGKLYADDLEPGSIEDSIKKWEFIAENHKDIDDDRGIKTCALCQEYFHIYCEGCPIYNFTGEMNCRDTPYYWFINAPQNEKKEAALAEVRFLEKVKEFMNEDQDQ